MTMIVIYLQSIGEEIWWGQRQRWQQRWWWCWWWWSWRWWWWCWWWWWRWWWRWCWCWWCWWCWWWCTSSLSGKKVLAQSGHGSSCCRFNFDELFFRFLWFDNTCNTLFFKHFPFWVSNADQTCTCASQISLKLSFKLWSASEEERLIFIPHSEKNYFRPVQRGIFFFYFSYWWKDMSNYGCSMEEDHP